MRGRDTSSIPLPHPIGVTSAEMWVPVRHDDSKFTARNHRRSRWVSIVDGGGDGAARDAQLRNVPLRLAHVIAPVSLTSSSSWLGVPTRAESARFRRDKTAAHQILELAHRAAEAAVSPGRKSPIVSETLIGAVVPTLADYAKDADMLVVGGRRRRRLARSLLGSVSSGLNHQAHCPVAVVHDDEPQAPRPCPHRMG